MNFYDNDKMLALGWKIRAPSNGAIWYGRKGKFTVSVRTPNNMHGTGGIIHLSIFKQNGDVFLDWREKQMLKNEICGEEYEGVELFPAEDRKVDGANQFHLWVLDGKLKFPFGFEDRLVTDNVQVHGGIQRPGSGATEADEKSATEKVTAFYQKLQGET